jgi:hypothetical protein
MSTALMRPASIYATAVFGLAGLSATHALGQNTGQTEERAPVSSAAPEEPPPKDALSERDAEVIRYILREKDRRLFNGGAHFFTTTPRDEWGEKGDWKPLPRSFLNSLLPLKLKMKVRPADEAYLKDGEVREKGTDRRETMHWITVNRWLSPTEVEVEDGSWQSELGGGASTKIYEKVKGDWQYKDTVKSWVS